MVVLVTRHMVRGGQPFRVPQLCFTSVGIPGSILILAAFTYCFIATSSLLFVVTLSLPQLS